MIMEGENGARFLESKRQPFIEQISDEEDDDMFGSKISNDSDNHRGVFLDKSTCKIENLREEQQFSFLN